MSVRSIALVPWLPTLIVALVIGCPPSYGEPTDCDDDDTTEGTDVDGDQWTVEEGDCDDGDPLSHPGAVETCDDADNDCDGEVDEDAVDTETLYADADGDGFGDLDAPVEVCPGASDAVANGDDCDDADATVFPGADEVVGDGVDQDCDGVSSVDVEYGHRDLEGGVEIAGADYLLGLFFEVGGDFLLTDMGMRLDSGTANVRMALYTDLGEAPDTLIASTAHEFVVQGDNVLPVEAPVIVSPGGYWLMAVYDDTAHVSGGQSFTIVYTEHEFLDDLPDPFVAPDSYGGGGLAYWLSGVE